MRRVSRHVAEDRLDAADISEHAKVVFRL